MILFTDHLAPEKVYELICKELDPGVKAYWIKGVKDAMKKRLDLAYERRGFFMMDMSLKRGMDLKLQLDAHVFILPTK